MRRRRRSLTLLLLLEPLAAAAQDPARWFSWGADHRTRYESEDRRYPAGPDGGDQQLVLRTRLRLRVQSPGERWHAMGEWWDARVALTSADSLITRGHTGPNRIAQLQGGFTFGASTGTRVTLEAGRFARDFGMRRLIARNIYRNTGNAYDGAMVTVAAPRWNVRLFALRPLIYRDEVARPDPAFRQARLAGIYYTNSARLARQFELYALFLNDRVERRFWAGVRMGRGAFFSTRRSPPCRRAISTQRTSGMCRLGGPGRRGGSRGHNCSTTMPAARSTRCLARAGLSTGLRASGGCWGARM